MSAEMKADLSDRSQVLLKLLQVEPDTIGNLTRATGWGEAETTKTLLQLIADGKVLCRTGNGFRTFFPVTTQSGTPTIYGRSPH